MHTTLRIPHNESPRSKQNKTQQDNSTHLGDLEFPSVAGGVIDSILLVVEGQLRENNMSKNKI